MNSIKISNNTYKTIYDLFLYSFAKEINIENVAAGRPLFLIDKNRSLVDEKKTKGKDKISPEFEISRFFVGSKIKSNFYLYRLYSSANNQPFVKIDTNVLINILKFLGVIIPEKLNNPSIIKQILNYFIKKQDTKVTIHINENVEYLISQKWWFCFRGHPQDFEVLENNEWWIVYNKMEFRFEDDCVKVSKIGSDVKVSVRYQDCFGSIDLDSIARDILVINVKNEQEHCHIKLNISGRKGRDLFVGEFLQYEHDGHIAILIKTNDDTAGEMKISNENYDLLPYPLKDIAFYFKEKGQNTRRTSNQSFSDVESLKQWKTKKNN